MNKRNRVGNEILSTPDKKTAGTKREQVGLATASPIPIPMAARKGTLAGIPKFYVITLGVEVEGYENAVSDSDSDSTSSIVFEVFPVGRDVGTKGMEKKDPDGGSDDRSRFLLAIMREG